MARTAYPTSPNEKMIERRWHAMEEHYKQRNLNILGWRAMYFRDHRQYFVNNEGDYEDPEADEIRVILPEVPLTVESMRELLLSPRYDFIKGRPNVSKERKLVAFLDCCSPVLTDIWGVISCHMVPVKLIIPCFVISKVYDLLNCAT